VCLRTGPYDEDWQVGWAGCRAARSCRHACHCDFTTLRARLDGDLERTVGSGVYLWLLTFEAVVVIGAPSHVLFALACPCLIHTPISRSRVRPRISAHCIYLVRPVTSFWSFSRIADRPRPSVPLSARRTLLRRDSRPSPTHTKTA
jgi:hypothetical protein